MPRGDTRRLKAAALILTLALGLLTAAGCASKMAWKGPPGTTEAQFRHDSVECQRQAYTREHVSATVGTHVVYIPQYFNRTVFRACMEGRGYQRVPPLG